ncbi:hypothetical protein D9758_003270 [Tetrapyrgos nigripes]|uniref:DNA polymerase V n=1 Tax=Tetrapyrgos nigripes TaxID=182062 RepID=A0A8H5LQK2_9AGAR|nr:hypothetical protein D9758_003270 [Tetrapyrgos nigripes]
MDQQFEFLAVKFLGRICQSRMAATTLPLFWNLSSASKEERIDASVKLVSTLEHFQSQFEPSSPEEDEDSPKLDALDTLNAQDVSYSVRRLIRGLASSRESSRLGFSVALTELLSRIDTITCPQITSLILDASKSQGSMTGQEERDILFARLFGMNAIIQSGLLVRTKPLPTSASSATHASSLAGFEQIVSELLALGEKKSWLRESAWWTLCLATDSVKDSEVSWKDEALRYILQRAFVDDKLWSPEKVAITLKLKNLLPEEDWRSLLSPTFKNSDICSNANLKTLASILKDAPTENEAFKSTNVHYKPQVHFAWDVLLEYLLLSSPNSDTQKGTFVEFFRVVVDESLFSATSSPERKYWGFQVFEKALSRVSERDLPMLFTKNFMRTWINHLSNRDRYLHKAAKQAATEVQKFAQSNPNFGFSLVLQLTGVNGNQQFDKLTRTKTVESLLISMGTEDIRQYVEHVLKEANDPETDVQSINTRRTWIIDQFSALIRNGSIKKSDEWVELVLDWLVVNGCFFDEEEEREEYNCRSARHTQTYLFRRAPANLSRTPSRDSKTKLPGAASDGQFWISKVLATIDQLKNDSKHASFISEMDEEDEVARLKAKEVLGKLRTVSGDNKDAAKGSELLLSTLLLESYCSEDSSASVENVQTCVEACTRMFLGKSKKKGRKSDIAESSEDVPEPVDMLVDIIIGFMEKSTAYLRTIGKHVFSSLCGAAKDSTIELILTQLENRDPTVEDNENDDAASIEDGEEDEEGVNDDSSESDDDDEDDEDDDSDEEPDEELRNKIMEALAVNGIEAAEDDDSDEDVMDDEQMMAIDEQLAEVFRSRMNERKNTKDVDAQRAATHFKNRVLDLVDIFLKRQTTNPGVIRFILPLVDLMTKSSSDEKQLSEKAQGILRSRIGKLKEVISSGDKDEIVSVLEFVHTRARNVHSADHLSTLSDCSIYLSLQLLHLGQQDSVLGIYRLSLADFMTRKNSSLHVSFFQSFIRRHRTSAWGLRNDLIELSRKAINAYRRCQVYQLFQDLISQPPSDIDQKEMAQFMKQLRRTLHDAISSSCGDDEIFNASQMRDVFKVAIHGARQTQKLLPNMVEEIWEPAIWNDLSNRLSSLTRYKGAVQMCKQLIQLSSPPKTEVSKRKAALIEGKKEDKQKKRKKVVHE